MRAAEARARQAAAFANPQLSLETEDFAGSGPYRHFTQAQTNPRTPTWGSHFQPGASDLISLAPGGRSVVKFRAVTATRWDLVNVGADTSFSEKAAEYRGALPTLRRQSFAARKSSIACRNTVTRWRPLRPMPIS